MLKQCYGTAVLLIVLIVALTDRTLSQVLPDPVDGNLAAPTQPASGFDEPICYMKTANGQLINLRELCENRLNQTALGNNQSFQRQRSFDNIRVRSPQTVRSGVGYERDSNTDD